MVRSVRDARSQRSAKARGVGGSLWLGRSDHGCLLTLADIEGQNGRIEKIFRGIQSALGFDRVEELAIPITVRLDLRRVVRQIKPRHAVVRPDADHPGLLLQRRIRRRRSRGSGCGSRGRRSAGGLPAAASAFAARSARDIPPRPCCCRATMNTDFSSCTPSTSKVKIGKGSRRKLARSSNPRGWTAPWYWFVLRSKRRSPMIKVSSSLESRTMRPTGGLVAAVRRPWYRRVLAPVMEALEKPPIPLVSSHSRCSAASRLLQTSLSSSIMTAPSGKPLVKSVPHMRYDSNRKVTESKTRPLGRTP